VSADLADHARQLQRRARDLGDVVSVRHDRLAAEPALRAAQLLADVADMLAKHDAATEHAMV